MTLRTLLLLATLAATPGCATLAPLDAARVAVGAATAGYEAANERVTLAKRGEEAACLSPSTPPSEAPACVAAAIERWRGWSAAVVTAYAAILDARVALALAAGNAAAGRPVDAAALRRAVAATLDAAGALAGLPVPGGKGAP